MGEHVEFPGADGSTIQGYLATPGNGSAGPALIVLGGGRVEAGTNVLCDRFASEGFTVLAVASDGSDQSDGGAVVESDGSVTAQIVIRAAAPTKGAGPNSMMAAVTYLEDHPLAHGQGVGLIGLDTGGIRALLLARAAAEEVRALVTFDGLALSPPNLWSDLAVPAECHVGLARSGSIRDVIHRFETEVAEKRTKVSVFRYADAGTRFWDETSSSHEHDADREAFIRTLSFLRAHLG